MRYPVRQGVQKGQSTIEFVVLALVMVPLLLLVPLIAKYMDIAQTTAVASRYVAFEGAARHSSSVGGWKTDAELGQEVRRRFFSNSDAPIKTNDSAGDFNAHRNAMWFDHRGNPLIAKFDNDVIPTSTHEDLSRPNVVAAAFAGKLGLSYDNLYTGQVRVNLANVAGLPPFDALNLSITRRTSVMVDPWAARGPNGVSAAIKRDGWDLLGPFPYKPLATAAIPVNVFIGLLQDSTVDVGAFNPDRVPYVGESEPYSRIAP